MEKTKGRKTYVPPEVIRVRLDPDQAVLGGCSTVSLGQGSSEDWSGFCRTNTPCKRFSTQGGANSDFGAST